MQTTSHLLMIRPAQFAYNAETAVNNSFQTPTQGNVQTKALKEFDAFVEVLTQNGIDVTVVQDSAVPHTPDSIFPNNWISFHSNGTICLYPMFATNRRLERKAAVLETIEKKFTITNRIDYTLYENEQSFLEGTGSMVLDRKHCFAYACLSPRTSLQLLHMFCTAFNYTPIHFMAYDAQGQAIYHTNVMMCVANDYAIICLQAILDETEKKHIVECLQSTGKEIIDIDLNQMSHFAGNMLQVHNINNEPFLVMSTQAFQSLSTNQIQRIEAYNPILHSNIETIETNGGGSARCMMAEIFLPKK